MYMNDMKIKSSFLLVFTFFITTNYLHANIQILNAGNDLEWNISGAFRPETFYGKNVSLLNNNNKTDKLWFARHIIDINLDALYGKNTYGYEAAEFLFTLRNKGVWGDPESIAKTVKVTTKDVNAVGEEHNHAIPRHIFWARELWLSFVVNEALGLRFTNNHSFTIGLFPFELGRGIALGAAYAVGPEILGFYTDAVVDQYAPGVKLSGGIIDKKLSYDIYTTILENKSNSLSRTAKKIRGQEYGRLENPARGFGKINFLSAVRFIWTVFDSEKFGVLNLEPYALYNGDPEQKIEFLADATSKLATIGVAGEYSGDRVEFGFDYAFNIGQQRVRGWDRNHVVHENRDGAIVETNSHILDPNNSNATVLFVPGSKAQGLIFNSVQEENQNGKVIGMAEVVSGDAAVTLQNADNRFRNPYTNKHEGWMVVGDIGFWLRDKKDLQLAFTAGAASGDDNPNEDTMDRVFSGFIPLQSIYNGKRVRSVFVLGGAGKLDRPLAEPTTNQAPSRFASAVSGFTDIVLFGTALHYKSVDRDKKIEINPNVMAFWQHNPIKKFDAQTKKELKKNASNYLGTEINLFFKYNLLKDLKFFFVGSTFFPGQHFTDIKGKPLDSGQQKELDRLDRTGFSDDAIPNIGDDMEITLNFGLQFTF